MAIDFDAPCNIEYVTDVLHDRNTPLTSSVVEQLRGCLVLLYFRTPRTGSSAVYLLLQELATVLGFTSILDKPPSVNSSRHASWVSPFTSNYFRHIICS